MIKTAIPTSNRMDTDTSDLQRSLEQHLKYTVGKNPVTATFRDWFNALAHAVRDRLAERWMSTSHRYYQQDSKRVYYLSLEFLIGRSLGNAMINLGIDQEGRQALANLGLSPRVIEDMEADAALGNGGLGRLAACFMDSLATLNLPGYGYGIRYEFGMFLQQIQDGFQVEQPDNWLRYGNPWEFSRPEVLYKIRFGGGVVEYRDEFGRLGFHWGDTEDIMAMAYDIPIPGYGGQTVNNLRLWSAKASRDIDLKSFNEGNYLKAVADKNNSESLSKVLYPSDATTMGRELRLRQEYFFVSASVQDILRRYLSIHDDLHGLPDKVAIQLNDTHPALAIPELLRLLVDRHRFPWEQAWDIATRVFAYTNHTLLPEALETWPVALFERLLPRHLQIIYEINHRFLKEVGHRHPGDLDRLRRLSIIGEEGEKHVRMAHLAVVGSHRVNGVAALHTRLLKESLFADFEDFFPGRIVNKTNGITPRRWLHHANPELSALLGRYLGSGWITDLQQLQGLTLLVEDPVFRAAFQTVKHANKQRLANYIHEQLHLRIDPDSLFDVQIKRIHEYKRQLLNVLHVITRYNRIRAHPDQDIVARTVIFAGKAAPGYVMAKSIIKLINDVADIINHDPLVGDRLKVVFIPNYDVTIAERIIPAADLSEQISTAGTEASGTGNMKLALNGALTIGTLDGANVEIRDQVGEDNIFIFGLTAEEVADLSRQGYNPWDIYHANPELKQALEMLNGGYFSSGEPWRFNAIVDALTYGGDQYRLLADYTDYIDCQNRVDKVYGQPEQWTRRAILNVARMGRFSSDRTIQEYAGEIWGIKPVI